MLDMKFPAGGPGGPGGGPGGPPKAGYTERKPVTDWILEESATFPNGVILQEGHLPAAAEGKALLMTVDGVVTEIQPGVYPGKVVLTVYGLSHVPENQAELSVGDFRTAIYVKDGQPQPTCMDFRSQPGVLAGIDLNTAISDMNGVIWAAEEEPETPFVIRDSRFACSGGGTSEGRGACLLTVGKAKVKLENVEFWNHGTLTAIVASGHSQLEVANSLIYGTRDFSSAPGSWASTAATG